MYNLTVRSYHPRLECFYRDGDDEWYVGYLRLCEGAISVNFTAYEYKAPRGLENYVLPPEQDLDEGCEFIEEWDKPEPKAPKVPSKFKSWRKPGPSSRNSNKLGFMSDETPSQASQA